MQRYLLLLPAFFLAAFLLPEQVEQGALPRAEAFTAELQISEDPTNGHITVETGIIRAVWHTRTLASESYNQGGGALYGLYHKPTDPEMSRNLIAYPSFTGWGNGQSTALWSGSGGVGAPIRAEQVSYMSPGTCRPFNRQRTRQWATCPDR